MNQRSISRYIVGIDEVGRGPIAGPVTVGVFMVSNDNYKKFLKLVKELKITDSKKITEKKRKIISDELCDGAKNNLWNFTISMSSVKMIDTKGIVPAINRAVEEGVSQLMKKNNLTHADLEIFLDGGLKLSDESKKQKTVIKGDLLIPAISAASILAKVHRDHYMELVDKKYDKKYDWSRNKGYGTKKHYNCLKKYGISDLHRKTFLKNLI